jgi:hypothetical protein
VPAQPAPTEACSAAYEPDPLALTHDPVDISAFIAIVLAAPDPKAVLVVTVDVLQPQSVAQPTLQGVVIKPCPPVPST